MYCSVEIPEAVYHYRLSYRQVVIMWKHCFVRLDRKGCVTRVNTNFLRESRGQSARLMISDYCCLLALSKGNLLTPFKVEIFRRVWEGRQRERGLPASSLTQTLHIDYRGCCIELSCQLKPIWFELAHSATGAAA